MDNWKQKIIKAYRNGKTIQSNNFGPVWYDFVPQNQLDYLNLDFGTEENWRIKPSFYCLGSPTATCKTQCERCEKHDILKKSGAYTETPMMKEERKYTKEHMLLFGGFCAGKFRQNPSITGEELWDEWEKIMS